MSTTESTSQNPTQKLYVGNVEYQTTKNQIHDLFKDYNVQSVEIPTIKLGRKGERGVRTKGYVFVNFGSETDLDSIIEKFTDFEFNGRKIYLRHPKIKSEDELTENSLEETNSNSKQKQKSKSTRSKSKSKSTKSESNPDSQINPSESETKSQPKKQSTPKPKREPKKRIPFDQGVKSTNTIYVRNLDRSLKVVDIKEYFTKEDETPVWISVPLLNLPRHVLKKLEAEGKSLERRNKGYAFVRFELPEGESIDNKVDKFNGKTFNDKELQVSVAIDVRNSVKQDEEIAQASEENPEAVN